MYEKSLSTTSKPANLSQGRVWYLVNALFTSCLWTQTPHTHILDNTVQYTPVIDNIYYYSKASTYKNVR